MKDEISISSFPAAVEHCKNNAIKRKSSPFALDLEINSCVDKRLVAAFSGFVVETVKALGMEVSKGPAPLAPKITRWTVLSSPFVHKTARTQLERREHGNALRIDGVWGEEIGAKLVWYLRKHVPNELELSLKFIERI